MAEFDLRSGQVVERFQGQDVAGAPLQEQAVPAGELANRLPHWTDVIRRRFVNVRTDHRRVAGEVDDGHEWASVGLLETKNRYRAIAGGLAVPAENCRSVLDPLPPVRREPRKFSARCAQPHRPEVAASDAG